MCCQDYAEHHRHINHHFSQLDLGSGHPCQRQFKGLDPSMNLGASLKLTFSPSGTVSRIFVMSYQIVLTLYLL